MPSDDFDNETAILAGELLSRVWGEPVKVAQGEILKSGRYTRVYRLDFAAAPQAAPASVVVKRVLSPPDMGERPEDSFDTRQRFRNESSGLEFLSTDNATSRLAPHAIATDSSAGMILLEDLGEVMLVDQILLGSNQEAAENALIDVAVTLGRLHSSTYLRRETYNQIQMQFGTARTELSPADKCARLIAAAGECARAVSLSMPRDVTTEIAGMDGFFADQGPYVAFVHNDACPDNFAVGTDGMKVWDFAFSNFGPFLVDGVYARMHFPSCWCVRRIPLELLDRMEDTYRSELVTKIPQAGDDELYQASIAEACAYLVLDMITSRKLPDQDQTWGTATERQRFVSRFESFAATTESCCHLTATGAFFSDLAHRLRSRWSDSDSNLPTYPAFGGPV